VLDTAHDVDVAVGIQGGEVAGVHPAVLVDGLGRAGRVVPVADHDGVAAGQELTGGAARHRVAGLGVGDLHLHVRVHPPDGGDPLVEVVVRRGLGGHRRSLGHAVTDGDLVHVHGRHPLLHDL